MERVYVFDTTLRDGEQSPGASMSVEQKLELAVQLARLGVDVIEAGFPVSSPQQFKACREIAAAVKGPAIAGLARALPKDLDAAIESIAGAERPRVHTFIASSPIHMQHKLKKNPDEVIEMAVQAVRYARNRVAEVEFSPEDATRSELPFLCRLLGRVIEAGASVLNIPDTVGYTTPDEFGAFIRALREGVPGIEKAVISVHCHNDLGLAVANTLSALRAGARQVEVTVNGIGERAGNAALEEVVMGLQVRRDILPYTTGVATQQLYNTSRLLSRIVGFPLPRNKPVVGENAFAHESGIHQDGVLKHRATYEIMTPEAVGRDTGSLVLGRHSGLHGFRKRLGELGLSLPDEDLKKAYERFLEIADRKKEVYDDDLFVIVSDELGKKSERFLLDYFSIQSGNRAVPTATVRIRRGEELLEDASTGDGPVDAIFNAIDRALCTADMECPPALLDFNVQAVTPGREAIGEVSVTLQIGTGRYTGRGASTDILEASARAYINALNRHQALASAAAATNGRA